jgi:hypothetical protein
MMPELMEGVVKIMDLEKIRAKLTEPSQELKSPTILT